MKFDRVDLWEQGNLEVQGFPGCCGAMVVRNFEEDVPTLDSLWDEFCEVLTRAERDNRATYVTLSESSQKEMIDLFDACPYCTQIDEFKSRQGNYKIRLYRVQVKNYN